MKQIYRKDNYKERVRDKQVEREKECSDNIPTPSNRMIPTYTLFLRERVCVCVFTCEDMQVGTFSPGMQILWTRTGNNNIRLEGRMNSEEFWGDFWVQGGVLKDHRSHYLSLSFKRFGQGKVTLE